MVEAIEEPGGNRLMNIQKISYILITLVSIAFIKWHFFTM